MNNQDEQRPLAEKSNSTQEAQQQDPTRSLRWGIYSILIVLATGNLTGRILAVNSVNFFGLEKNIVNRKVRAARKELEKAGITGEELQQELARKRQEIASDVHLQRPFLSGNDRSRWIMIRALVEHGGYSIDEIVQEPMWDTIDMVKHKDREGNEHLYSSKPPLLPTMIAGVYWVIVKTTGMTLGTHPFVVGRMLLILVNVIPMMFMFWLLAKIIDSYGRTDWGRIFAMAVATLGTFLTTFAVALNNHLFAAISVTITLYCLLKIVDQKELKPRYFVLAGLFAAFAVVNELPALAFLGLVGLLLLWKAPRQTLMLGLPSVLFVAAAFFGTNYVAHNSLRPPYAHRSQTDPEDNWYHYEYIRNGRMRQSYWMNRRGIDSGEEKRSAYVLHALVGHHGVFSLTPVWLLTVVGLGIWLAKGSRNAREIAALITMLSLIVITFYLMRPQVDRNYGGMTSGFRWLFWFAPMWIWGLLPATDWFARRCWSKTIALVLLGVSVLSASYPVWNPWTHPWLANFMIYMEWINFS